MHNPSKAILHSRVIQPNETVGGGRPRTIRPNETVEGEHPRTILSNKIVGAVPVCPPERPRSGVSIPKIHALYAGMNDGCAPAGATRAGTQAPPLPISTKPRGVPLPHRGYTFESAGLASVTQPTLGNNASEKATPWGLYFFSSHILTTHSE